MLYFLDGAAAFDDEGWGVPSTASALWRLDAIDEVIIVGIDNGGSTVETIDPVRDRASEYLPYPDQTWTDSPSPEPRGERFPAFLFGEVMPMIDSTYRTETDGATTGLAGDSYAAVAAALSN